MNNDLTDFLNKKIYHWVGRNFGSQEADDPSWNIRELSKYLAKELEKKESEEKGLIPHELTLLFRTTTPERPALDTIEQKIRNFGGIVRSTECDGKKRLAYSIQNEDFAIYYYLNIDLPKDTPAKLSSWLNINDDVLRHLLVREDTRRR